MRLTTRLSRFFFGALALVLLAYSVTLFVLVDYYLHRQSEERLAGVLNTLTAAVEVGPDGVEWEPGERRLLLGGRHYGGEVLWCVRSPGGRIVDGTAPVELVDSLFSPIVGVERHARTRVDREGADWLVVHRRVAPVPHDLVSVEPRELDEEGKEPSGVYPALTVSAAVELGPVHAAVRWLALILVSLSLAIGILAFVSSRQLIERALRPVSVMAQAAASIEGEELEGRLPLPDTSDELQELGVAFNALLDRLQESFERQRRFTGDASHQLRTPLTAMQGEIDVALRTERNPTEYRRVLSVVQSKARHLRQIIDALLFLARGDGEAIHPPSEPMDLLEWLRGHAWPASVADRAHELALLLPDQSAIWVQAQPVFLAELLNNLVENAARYSPRGGRITLSVAHLATTVDITVEDHGYGIPAADLDHVFEPFFRSSEARRRGLPGTGLGLTVADRLARSLGGEIRVESRLGEGSRFTVRLPSAAVPTSPPAEESVAPGMSGQVTR